MSFSQFGEDLIIAKLLDGLLSAPGNLIDIGAYEPEAMSNSRLLIEHGWDATLIEFSPHPLRNLVDSYNEYAGVRVIAAAVTPEPQQLIKFRMTDDAISSDDPNVEARWKGVRPGYDGGFYGDLWVPTITPQKILEQFYGPQNGSDDYKPVHFASIDTEGSSVEIAINFMQQPGPWRPLVICVEHDDKMVYLMERAQQFGYALHHLNGCNAILELKA